MDRKILLMVLMAFILLIPIGLSAKKPKLNGSIWVCDKQIMLMDVGMTGTKESFIFTSKNEVTILREEWKIVELTGTPRELYNPDTGETTIVSPPPLRTTKNFNEEFKGTYKLKKVKVNGKKLWRVYLTIDGKTSEYAIDGDLMIPSTSSLSDQRIFKKN